MINKLRIKNWSAEYFSSFGFKGVINSSLKAIDNADNFNIVLTLMIGTDSPGEDNFELSICTPKWLKSTYSSKEVEIGIHLLIVFQYNFEKTLNCLKEKIVKISEKTKPISKDNWRNICEKINTITRWEFEDSDEWDPDFNKEYLEHKQKGQLATAKIVDVYSPDIDLKTFIPKDSKNFYFRLNFVVENSGDSKRESFEVKVCTPDWLLDNHSKDDIIIGLHYLIAFEYNMDRIVSKLKKEVKALNAISWERLIQKIDRIGLRIK